MYNTLKFKIFVAINECNDESIAATPPLIALLTGVGYDSIRGRISKLYFQDYLTRKPYYENKRFKSFQYALSAKGKSVLEKYSKRMLDGHDLNIRRKPQEHDWAGFDIMPNAHVLDEMKAKKKGRKHER